jgi:RNA polymerase-binding transcription factor DksA
MADIAEQAERQEQLARDVAIRIRQSAIERDRREKCVDCGDRIPEGRISCRCVPCQTEIEKNGKQANRKTKKIL